MFLHCSRCAQIQLSANPTIDKRSPVDALAATERRIDRRNRVGRIGEVFVLSIGSRLVDRAEALMSEERELQSSLRSMKTFDAKLVKRAAQIPQERQRILRVIDTLIDAAQV